MVILVGARLNWLLAHGKGKTWGGAPKQFIQIDISPTEIDSNVAIAAPLIGDVGSCVSALLAAMGTNFPRPNDAWIGDSGRIEAGFVCTSVEQAAHIFNASDTPTHCERNENL